MTQQAEPFGRSGVDVGVSDNGFPERPPKGDYVEVFQALAQVRLRIKREGKSPELLAEVALLEFNLGNPANAKEAAEECLALVRGLVGEDHNSYRAAVLEAKRVLRAT